MPKPNWWAKKTDPAKYQKRVDTEPFRYIQEQYGKKDSIYEVGCGAGVWADNHKFYGKEGMYKGTDVTPEYVIESQKQHPEYEWEVIDANTLPDKDNSWDVSLAMHVLEYTLGYKKSILEMCRISRKKVILDFWIEFTDIEKDIIIERDTRGNITFSRYSKDVFNKFINSIPGWKLAVDNKKIADSKGRVNFIWILEAV